MCDRSRLKEVRHVRLTQNTIPNYIELGLVKSLIKQAFDFNLSQKFTPKYVKRRGIGSSIPDFIINVIALHLNIMFKDYTFVQQFLKLFTKVHGLMATKLLVNYQFVENVINPCCGNAINALMVACLWTNDTKIINILYNYGADISSINSSGLYCEELHSNIPYYNHFAYYFKYKTGCSYNNNHIWGYRISNNFLDIIQHVRLITGEAVQFNFEFPIRMIREHSSTDYNYEMLQTESPSEGEHEGEVDGHVENEISHVEEEMGLVEEDDNVDDDDDGVVDINTSITPPRNILFDEDEQDLDSIYSNSEDEDIINV